MVLTAPCGVPARALLYSLMACGGASSGSVARGDSAKCRRVPGAARVSTRQRRETSEQKPPSRLRVYNGDGSQDVVGSAFGNWVKLDDRER